MPARKGGKIILNPPTQSEILEDETIEDDENIWSPLQLASRDGKFEEARKLIESTTSDDSKKQIVNESPHGWYGQTALQAACANGHLAIVNLLLEAGAEAAPKHLGSH